MINVDLKGANLRDADLNNVILNSADLEDANGITNEELEQQTIGLAGATMPNGSEHP